MSSKFKSSVQFKMGSTQSPRPIRRRDSSGHRNGGPHGADDPVDDPRPTAKADSAPPSLNFRTKSIKIDSDDDSDKFAPLSIEIPGDGPANKPPPGQGMHPVQYRAPPGVYPGQYRAPPGAHWTHCACCPHKDFDCPKCPVFLDSDIGSSSAALGSTDLDIVCSQEPSLSTPISTEQSSPQSNRWSYTSDLSDPGFSPAVHRANNMSTDDSESYPDLEERRRPVPPRLQTRTSHALMKMHGHIPAGPNFKLPDINLGDIREAQKKIRHQPAEDAVANTKSFKKLSRILSASDNDVDHTSHQAPLPNRPRSLHGYMVDPSAPMVISQHDIMDAHQKMTPAAGKIPLTRSQRILRKIIGAPSNADDSLEESALETADDDTFDEDGDVLNEEGDHFTGLPGRTHVPNTRSMRILSQIVGPEDEDGTPDTASPDDTAAPHSPHSPHHPADHPRVIAQAPRLSPHTSNSSSPTHTPVNTPSPTGRFNPISPAHQFSEPQSHSHRRASEPPAPYRGTTQGPGFRHNVTPQNQPGPLSPLSPQQRADPPKHISKDEDESGVVTDEHCLRFNREKKVPNTRSMRILQNMIGEEGEDDGGNVSPTPRSQSQTHRRLSDEPADYPSRSKSGSPHVPSHGGHRPPSPPAPPPVMPKRQTHPAPPSQGSRFDNRHPAEPQPRFAQPPRGQHDNARDLDRMKISDSDVQEGGSGLGGRPETKSKTFEMLSQEGNNGTVAPSVFSHEATGSETAFRKAKDMQGPTGHVHDKQLIGGEENFCVVCGNELGGRHIKVKGFGFHPDCFNCQRCGASMKNKGYCEIDGLLCCRDCRY